ncbi:MAG: DNA mismatch repair endonuclease MutL [Deltaproteobacteria bacterium]|nr:DNA mismatch repair endonuclease MutL [Deltaproteobacteria bacterium]
MGKIKALPPEVVSKIAAGEVVERPASVVKELTENALDAGSKNIRIEVQAGGRKLIRVIDDGEGMTPEDALLALQRYSTSKIEKEEDLFAIHTFGFRGEALSSIAAVSKMKMVTRKEGELAGVEIKIEGGLIQGPEATGCPLGTSVQVRDLFYNIPARLKFLKTQGTELSHIGEVIAKIALANSQTHFQLYHDGKLLANYPVRQDLSSRLAEALGQEAGENMYFFQSRSKEIEVEGYAGEPGLNRPNARGIYLFVNRRPVRDRLLSHAVMEAYRNLLPKDRYPVVVLFVNLPPSEVDVNVHPSKWEVKFADSEAVYRRVVSSVREVLERTPWLQKGRGKFPELKEIPGVYMKTDLEKPYHFKPQEAIQFASPPSGLKPTPQAPFLGQVDKTYLLFESFDGLILIDQHAAHERVLLERILEEFSAGSIQGQPLLFPEMIELSFPEAKATEEHLLELGKMGFEVEPCGDRTFWVKSVPQILSAREPIRTLKEMIQQISSWGKNIDLQSSFDSLLQMMACRGAIQASQPMSPEEAKELLAELQKCSFPSRCPHGRPTLLKITLSELEKMFGRK